MKKIFLVLFLLLMSFGYGNNLNKYESKRVFDKFMDMMITANYEKYKNDKEMARTFEDADEAEEKEYLTLFHDFVKNNKYEVISVDERANKSILKVKAVYTSYDKIPIDEYLKELGIASKEIGVKDDESELTDRQTFEVYKKLKEKFKNTARTSEKTIEVYMNKKNGLWDVNIEENTALLTTMFPVTTEFMELLTGN